MTTQPEALRLADVLDADLCEFPLQEVSAELRRQHARIAELESQLMCNCEWQSIETAPKDGTRILLHPAVEVHDAWSKGYWSEQQECWIVGGSASGLIHTYWHALPPSPRPTTSAGSGKVE